MGLKSKIGNKLRPVAECTYVRTYIHVRKLATTMRSVDHGGITMNGTQLTLTGRNGLKERGNNFHSVTTRFAVQGSLTCQRERTFSVLSHAAPSCLPILTAPHCG